MNKKNISIIIMAGLALVAIIPSMDFFNGENGKATNKNIVFEYKDKSVYESEMLPYINYYSRMNQMPDDINTKNMAVDNYIRSVLMAQYAEDNGYSVKDEEVQEFIKKSKPFLEDEKFSIKKYEEFLKLFNIKNYVFEGEIRKDLLIVKMMADVDHNSNIEDYYFNIINEVLAQRRTIKKIKLNIDNIPVVYDKKLLENKYNDNKDKYRKEDFIIFSKNTFIHPLNQSDNDIDKDTVIVETTAKYNDLKNTNITKMSSKIIEGFKNSTMMLNKSDFIKLIGTKKINQDVKAGTFYIDNEGIDNGILTVYEVTNVTIGEIKDFSEAYYDLTRDYELDFKINKAYETIGHYENIKDAVGNYFSNYEEEIIDPLENDKSEDLYKIVYSSPLNKLNLYYNKETGIYYFIQLSKIDKIELTKEQNEYFRISQNNMYKQFILLSLYESVKREYKLIKHTKK